MRNTLATVALSAILSTFILTTASATDRRSDGAVQTRQMRATTPAEMKPAVRTFFRDGLILNELVPRAPAANDDWSVVVAELNLACGEWFAFWEEDEDGEYVEGTFVLHCGGVDIPFD